jgi:hypothetical protein
MSENFEEYHMTVGELKTLLSGFPDDYHVVLSSDGEGNNFSPLSAGDPGFYIPESTWAGEVYMELGGALGLDETDQKFHNDLPVESANCVILWPVN